MRAWLYRSLTVAVALLSARASAAPCAEHVPAGATKPTLIEKIEPRARAGDLVQLEVAVKHLAGETATLPADLPRLVEGEVRVADDGTFGKGELPKTAPDPGDPTHATTILKVPFVVLSTALERKSFTLPPVRIVVLRKGGGDLSVCTASHEIAIDQPTANEPEPWPRPNPTSVPQRTLNEHAKALATAIALSRRGLRTLRQNFFWAYGYNVVLVPFAAGALYPWLRTTVSPVLAAAAMSLSSIFVLGNSLRLRRFSSS